MHVLATPNTAFWADYRESVFRIRIWMDPGFFADPNPDFKNLDPDPLLHKPYNSWAASVQTQSKAFVAIVHCSHLTFKVVEVDAGHKRLGSSWLVTSVAESEPLEKGGSNSGIGSTYVQYM